MVCDDLLLPDEEKLPLVLHVIIFLILSESLMSLNLNLSGFEDKSVVWHVMPKLYIWNGKKSGLEPDREQHC